VSNGVNNSNTIMKYARLKRQINLTIFG